MISGAGYILTSVRDIWDEIEHFCYTTAEITVLGVPIHAIKIKIENKNGTFEYNNGKDTREEVFDKFFKTIMSHTLLCVLIRSKLDQKTKQGINYEELRGYFIIPKKGQSVMYKRVSPTDLYDTVQSTVPCKAIPAIEDNIIYL
jgi:hypothetical protein